MSFTPEQTAALLAQNPQVHVLELVSNIVSFEAMLL